MFADFQEVGKEHCCMDILKSFVRHGVIALAVSFRVQQTKLARITTIATHEEWRLGIGRGLSTWEG